MNSRNSRKRISSENSPALNHHMALKISINGQTYINFSSNDYLNLSSHPEIVKTAIRH